MTEVVAQLVYVSRPRGLDGTMLESILRTACVENGRRGITGVLVSRDDIFLQLLEGPRRAVSETFARIMRDPRHAEVVLLGMQDADFRLFGGWQMRDDRSPTWLWTPAQVAAGAPLATPLDEVMQMLHRIAATPG